MFLREVEQQVQKHIDTGNSKILFLWGPRRAGKTTILKKFAKNLGVPFFNFDLISDREVFSLNREALAKLSELPYILIDEVQNYPESSLALKILYDEFGAKIIATGSSELRATGQNADTLAGRFRTLHCLPLSLKEILNNTEFEAYREEEVRRETINKLMLFGGYPEVYLLESEEEKRELLENLLSTFVLKDVIDLYNLKNAKLALDLLTRLAVMLGRELSIREIAAHLNANAGTVTNYLEIFTKNYVLLPVPALKIDGRRSVGENKKYYFLDLGLRNLLVRDFRPLNLRVDAKAILENILVSELTKEFQNKKTGQELSFYREYAGRGVDLVISDFQKNYTCISVGKAQENSFPLKHTSQFVADETGIPNLLFS